MYSGIMSILPIATANSTSNSTMTMTGSGYTSAGTATTMSSRNSTMTRPTLTSTQTTADSTATNDAGFQGTSTSADGAEQTDNAAVSNQGKSSLAFAVGALAAVLYLH